MVCSAQSSMNSSPSTFQPHDIWLIDNLACSLLGRQCDTSADGIGQFIEGHEAGEHVTTMCTHEARLLWTKLEGE